MSSKQRLEVWNGARKKTSGGLQKKDLIKNKRGRVVSKKKSEQAADQNNLGSWLVDKGAKVKKGDMLRQKNKPPPDVKPDIGKPPKPKPAPAKKSQAPKKATPAAPKKSKAAPKKATPAAVPQQKAVPKAAPKKAAKPKKAAAAKPKKKTKIVRAESKSAPRKGKINPLTQQAYDPGAHGKVSLDNVRRTRLRRKKFDPLKSWF